MYIYKDCCKKIKLRYLKSSFFIFSQKIYTVPNKSGLFWVYDLGNISELSYKNENLKNGKKLEEFLKKF